MLSSQRLICIRNLLVQSYLVLRSLDDEVNQKNISLPYTLFQFREGSCKTRFLVEFWREQLIQTGLVLTFLLWASKSMQVQEDPA